MYKFKQGKEDVTLVLRNHGLIVTPKLLLTSDPMENLRIGNIIKECYPQYKDNIYNDTETPEVNEPFVIDVDLKKSQATSSTSEKPKQDYVISEQKQKEQKSESQESKQSESNPAEPSKVQKSRVSKATKRLSKRRAKRN